MENLPRTDKGTVDYSQDFFGKRPSGPFPASSTPRPMPAPSPRSTTFGPTFRAENSNTSRHLAEFWMIEPEVAFNDLEANAKLAEALLKYVFQAVLNERRDDLEFFAERIDKEAITRLEKFVSSDFPRSTIPMPSRS
jgi:asparaginyl-tRNA synthetase